MIDRDRVTEHVSVSTIRLELKRAAQPLVTLLIGFVVAIFAGSYILNGIDGGIGGTRTLKLQVADATGVVPGRGEVRFLGIQAGQIENAQLEHGHAVLTVTVAKKYGDIYKNAQAAVRPNTALQDMYLDITDRGTPSAGVAGPNYTIPLDQTESPTNLANVLDLFQPDVRAQVNNILTQFGNGLQDRGSDLRTAFVELAPFLNIAGNISRQLAVRADLTKDLVHNAAVLSGTLASRSSQLHTLVTQGTRTLEALSTEGGVPLKQTIAEGPATLLDVNRVFVNYLSQYQLLDHTVDTLLPAAGVLPAGLRNLRHLADSADPAVVKLQRPVRELLPLASALVPLANNLSGALTTIRPQVPDVNQVTQALSTCGNDINEFFNFDASMSKYVDSQGPMVRGNVNFGLYTEPTFHDTNLVQGHECAGGNALGPTPTPKLNGPAVAP